MPMKLHLRGEGPLSLAPRPHIHILPSFRSVGRQRPHILTYSAFKETEGSVETIDNDDASGAFAKFQPFSAEVRKSPPVHSFIFDSSLLTKLTLFLPGLIFHR